MVTRGEEGVENLRIEMRAATFFQDREAAERYVDFLEVLHQDPSRKDIAWLLGIDEDVMNEDVRLAEVRNWIERLVLPSMRH